MRDLARTPEHVSAESRFPVDVHSIPKIIHQLWKTERIPLRWQQAADSVRRHHYRWTYRLWTDAAMDEFVKQRHPDFYPIYTGFERNIMRADVFRYILMYELGGLYCDLDYEFLRPYDYSGSGLVLSLERAKSYGDIDDCVANYFFASVPKHPLWKDILDDLKNNPPRTNSFHDVIDATGPALVSRVLWQNQARYQGIRLTEKPVFSPQRVHGRYERKIYSNSGITYGFHHGSGSWKERRSLAYLKAKLIKLLRL